MCCIVIQIYEGRVNALKGRRKSSTLSLDGADKILKKKEMWKIEQTKIYKSDI